MTVPRGAALITSMIVLVMAASISCGPGESPATSCPNDVPATCPVPAATFGAEVLPLIQSRCANCHAPGGVESVRPMQSWEDVQKQKISILAQIHACLMPPADQPQLTPDERKVILGWIVCGALNN